MIDIDYYPVRGDHLLIGDAFLWEGHLWIRVGPANSDNEFPAFCLDPDYGPEGVVSFTEAGDPLTRVDLDITVEPATPRKA